MDLAAFEKRLNSDKQLRSEFLKDPVKILSKEGLQLGKSHAERLKQQLSAASTKAAAPGGNADNSDSVGISVSHGF